MTNNNNKPNSEEQIKSLSNSKYHSFESEESLLGIILNNPENLTNVASYIRPTDFFFSQHKILYELILEISNESQGQVSDVAIISLAQQKELTETINYDLLYHLVSVAGYSSYTDSLVKRISNLSEIRAIEFELNNVVDLLKNDKESLDKEDLLQHIESKILEITRNEGSTDFKDIKTLNEEFWADFTKRKDLNNIVSGVPSNYPDLDTMTNGFQNGDLIIIAARPSMGKTAFALNLVLNALKAEKPSEEVKEKAEDIFKIEDSDEVASNIEDQKESLKKKYRVALFSLEMPSKQLIERFYSIVATVPSFLVKKPNLITYDDTWAKLELTKGYLSGLNLFIDDSSSNKISELTWKLRRLNKVKKLDMVVIDYLQLLSGDKEQGDGNRQNEISKISRTLKQMARELNVPVIALSQLSREVEKRTKKTPILSDLRESGAIEQDADIVMFLHREDYYADKTAFKKDSLSDNKSNDNLESKRADISITDVIIAKHRNGPIGTIKLQFMPTTGAFGKHDTKSDELEKSNF